MLLHVGSDIRMMMDDCFTGFEDLYEMTTPKC